MRCQIQYRCLPFKLSPLTSKRLKRIWTGQGPLHLRGIHDESADRLDLGIQTTKQDLRDPER